MRYGSLFVFLVLILMENGIKPESLLELISSIISAIFFLFSTLIGWFIPNSGYFLLVSGLILIISILAFLITENKKIKNVTRATIPFSLVFAVLSGIGLFYHEKSSISAEDNKRLCELTEEAIEMFNDSNLSWFSEGALVDNIIRYFYSLPEAKIPTQKMLSLVFDTSLLENGEDVPFTRRSWSNTGTKYALVIIGMEKVKQDLDEKLFIPLPYSVNMTVCGYSCLNQLDWKQAEYYFNEAYKLDNGVAAYFLYVMYKNSCGMKPDVEHQKKAFRYLNESAKMGYRKAQLEFGQVLISSESFSDVALGADYLKNASLLSDFRSGYGMTTMERAIETLQEYYWNTGQYKEAYKFSGLLLKHNKLERQKYERHLDNCILINKFKEADDIIRKGKLLGMKDPQHSAYCYISEAILLFKGLDGRSVDLPKAERLLRFASDSLDSKYAKQVLSELYSNNGYEELSSYWSDLYNVDFHKTIKER